MRGRCGLLLAVALLLGGCRAAEERAEPDSPAKSNWFEEMFKGEPLPKPAPKPVDPFTSMPNDGPAPVWPTGPVGNPISLEMQSPAPVPGVDLPVRLTLTNKDRMATPPYTLVQPVPETAQLVRSDPPAVLRGSQLVWDVGPIAAGQSQVFTVTYRPAKSGPLGLKAEVVGPAGVVTEAKPSTSEAYSPPTNLVSQRAPTGTAELALQMTGPPGEVPGDTVAYDVRIANPGNAAATNLLLTAEFDAGLEHESGARRLEIPIPQLPAGANRSVQLPLTVRSSGRLRTLVKVRAENAGVTSEERTLEVSQPQLEFALAGPPSPLLGQPATWTLRVYNPGGTPAKNVVLRVQLPAELQFQSATSGGQLSAGQVVWQFRQLDAKEPQSVQFTAVGRQMVDRSTLIAAAHAERVPEVRSEIPLDIRGTPILRVKLKGAEDTAPVGAGVIYAIDVSNPGSVALTDVDVIATVPPSMRPLFGSGPTMVTIEGERVIVGRIARIEPGRTVTIKFEAEALRSGDARVKVEAKCPQFPTPVVQEEATRIVPAK